MTESVSRRTLLRATAGGVAAVAAGSLVDAPAASAAVSVLQDLERKIRLGMERYDIPGVALGLWYRGTEYVRGFGVTNVDDPAPVDGDTVFRVGSTTKTFTGTAVMRLVERGRLDLDRKVRDYLPEFRTADAAASGRVTVRTALNHTAGWLGDFFLHTGFGEDALARYVSAMSRLPQLTPPGSTFAYNNAALCVAGRLIEVVTGQPYETAVRDLVVRPLRLGHSAYFLEDLPGASVATSHVPDETGRMVAAPEYFTVPRSINAAGGLISSARDQIRWARYHLGSGRPLLTSRSLRRMQSHPGPGGTLFVELDGVGITWMLRPTAQGPVVVQHGGDWAGQHSGFLLVPERDFAMTLLTNSEGGPGLVAELFADDWALRRFARVSNLPGVPVPQPAPVLAAYEGQYTAEQIGLDGTLFSFGFDVVADAAAGALSLRVGGQEGLRMPFYRRDYVRLLYPDGTDTYSRANFVRGRSGAVEWLRYGGRLFKRSTAATLRLGTTALPPLTLPYPLPTGFPRS